MVCNFTMTFETNSHLLKDIPKDSFKEEVSDLLQDVAIISDLELDPVVAVHGTTSYTCNLSYIQSQLVGRFPFLSKSAPLYKISYPEKDMSGWWPSIYEMQDYEGDDVDYDTLDAEVIDMTKLIESINWDYIPLS
ncbi:hypothetical protein GEMRC1_013295 [Eukaryota sp. GEM-RC1]